MSVARRASARVAAALAALALAAGPAPAAAPASPPPAAPAMPAAAGAPAETLGVAECMRLARERAPEALAATADLEAARGDSAAVAHYRRPAYSLFGDVLVAPDHFYDPVITNLGEYEAKIGLAWPWLDGGSRRRDAQRGALGAGRAALARSVSAREAADQAAELALTRVRLAEEESAQAAAVEWLDRLAREMESGVRGGARDRGDALRVELERDQAASDLDATRRDAREVARALARWLGLGVDAAPAVRAPDPALDAGPTPGDSLQVLAAFARAPETAIAALDAARARLELQEAAHRNALHVDVALDAGLAGSDLTATVPGALRATNPSATLTDRLHRDLGASAALQFKLPVADPGARPSVGARAADVRASDVRRAAEADAEQRAALDLLARWRGAAARLDAAARLAARADEHLLRQRSLYAAGALPLLELLDARRLHDDALARLAAARFDVRRARTEMEERRSSRVLGSARRCSPPRSPPAAAAAAATRTRATGPRRWRCTCGSRPWRRARSPTW